MKYLFWIALVGMSTSMAMADDNQIDSGRDRLEGRHEVRFDCKFRSRGKKSESCHASGEVCVDFGGRKEGNRREGCDRDRDDNHLRVWCSNGLRDSDRARAFLSGGRDHDRGRDFDRDRDHDRERDEDLIIRSLGSDEKRIEIKNVSRLDDSRDRDDEFRAKLSFDRDGRWDNDEREMQGRLFGHCSVEVERDHGHDHDDRPQP